MIGGLITVCGDATNNLESFDVEKLSKIFSNPGLSKHSDEVMVAAEAATLSLLTFLRAIGQCGDEVASMISTVQENRRLIRKRDLLKGSNELLESQLHSGHSSCNTVNAQRPPSQTERSHGLQDSYRQSPARDKEDLERVERLITEYKHAADRLAFINKTRDLLGIFSNSELIEDTTKLTERAIAVAESQLAFLISNNPDCWGPKRFPASDHVNKVLISVVDQLTEKNTNLKSELHSQSQSCGTSVDDDGPS